MFYVNWEEAQDTQQTQDTQDQEFLINQSIAKIQENALGLRGSRASSANDDEPPPGGEQNDEPPATDTFNPHTPSAQGGGGDGVTNGGLLHQPKMNTSLGDLNTSTDLTSVKLIRLASEHDIVGESGVDVNGRLTTGEQSCDDDPLLATATTDLPKFGLIDATDLEEESLANGCSSTNRSSTLRSFVTEDYDTPPETPDFPSSGSVSLNSTLSQNNETALPNTEIKLKSGNSVSFCDIPPVPPPRPKRRRNQLKLKSLDLQDSSHQNDLLFRTDSFPLSRKNNDLKGRINILFTSPVGLRSQWRERWVVYDNRDCRLRIYKSCEETDKMEQEIDVLSATFNYNLDNPGSGEFTICTKDVEQCIDVGSAENRQYWLQQLQKGRREYTQSVGGNNRLMARSSIGLLREKSTPDESKESSPYRDILATLERPLDISMPKSADYNAKKSFFPSFARKPSFKQLVRSSSDRTPSPTGMDPKSPPLPPSKPSPTNSQGFQALSKIRRSLRDKRPPLGHLRQTSLTTRKPEDLARELESLKEDLQASQDDATACREVISVLQTQVKAIEKERDTLRSLRPELSEGELLEILREKDRQLVEAETQALSKQAQMEQLQEKIEKLERDAAAYIQLIEVKDKSIIRMTNSIHEMELQDKIKQETPPLPDGTTFYYAEKVSLGTQTDADKTKEALEDTVTAYEMQNRFLNKEVLELNQLRQQAIDREQKLFIEASDWEAKFYQIQSKYLLLLNELHNPQVMVSASRQEMVGHLLKDIVENCERPSLNSHSTECDRFGFRLNEEGSLEDRAERIRRQNEEFAEEMSEEEARRRWDSVVLSLERPGPLIITMDMKTLIRRGIPINLRGSVWKAIVDNRVRTYLEKPQSDYYQALLSNYNPGPQMCPAAKQIELDLLRTLPNNKHYESPHSSGIPKLRRVLLAYSLHNPEVEYCQGFNRIAAIALLFMNEEDAFWCLLYIVEQLMPMHYYCKQLVGAQVDQAVFKELVCEKLPDLAIHLENHGVDPALFSINWFLCLFVDSLPVNTYLHIWDAFLFEGCKVLFRYALAILSYMEEKLIKQSDYMSIFNTFRTEVESLVDVKRLTMIAFHELNPFPLRTINSKREHHHKILKAQMESLDVIRQDYRKNSLAQVKRSGCTVQSDEEEG